MRAARTICFAVAASAALPFLTLGADTGNGVAAYLARSFQLTPADLTRVARGQVVARTLDAKDDREVATLGVVRVQATPDFYVDRFEDIASFKKADAVLQIGAFNTSPRLDDVAALTLDPPDVESLRDCRVGECELQLPADAIRRFDALDWKRSDATGQANHVMREVLVEHVREYLAKGSSAMHYADKADAFSLHREFTSLVSTDTGGWQLFPDLRQHLVSFPQGRNPRTDDLVYWSKEQVGRKTVVSVTHLAIERLVNDSPAAYAVASRQIYGSHYFDASVGLTVLLNDRTTVTPATYVVYVNRSRIDMFGGLFGGVVKRVVTARARSTVATQLERMRQALERDFAAARSES